MRKKLIISVAIAVIIAAIIYTGFVKKGFIYYTGIATPYSYFQAKAATNDSILSFIQQTEGHPFAYVNIDSLALLYGFKWKTGSWEVSYSVNERYNSVIYNEMISRIGEKRWKEFQYKSDSMSDSASAIFIKGLSK